MGIAQLITTEPSQRKLSKLREMYSRKPWKWPCPNNFFLANYKLTLHWFSLFVPSRSLPFERVGHPSCLQYLRCSLRYSIKYWVSSALTCKNIRCSMSFWSLLCHRAEIISQLMGEIKLLKSENFMLFLVFFVIKNCTLCDLTILNWQIWLFNTSPWAARNCDVQFSLASKQLSL